METGLYYCDQNPNKKPIRQDGLYFLKKIVP